MAKRRRSKSRLRPDPAGIETEVGHMFNAKEQEVENLVSQIRVLAPEVDTDQKPSVLRKLDRDLRKRWSNFIFHGIPGPNVEAELVRFTGERFDNYSMEVGTRMEVVAKYYHNLAAKAFRTLRSDELSPKAWKWVQLMEDTAEERLRRISQAFHSRLDRETKEVKAQTTEEDFTVELPDGIAVNVRPDHPMTLSMDRSTAIELMSRLIVKLT